MKWRPFDRADKHVFGNLDSDTSGALICISSVIFISAVPVGPGIKSQSASAVDQASWRFPHVVQLAFSTRVERKFTSANWCQVSLHCQLRITTTITCGIQVVLSVERHMEWSDTGPFLQRHTVAYCCIPQ